MGFVQRVVLVGVCVVGLVGVPLRGVNGDLQALEGCLSVFGCFYLVV